MSVKGGSRDSTCSTEGAQTQLEGLPEPGPLPSSCLYEGCQTPAGWGGLAGPRCAAPASCQYRSSWSLLRPEALRGGSAVLLVSSGPLQSGQEGSQDSSGPGAAILSSISTGILGCGQVPERTIQNYNQLPPDLKQTEASREQVLPLRESMLGCGCVAHHAVK